MTRCNNSNNMRRWDGWWKVANREQLPTFITIGLLTLIGLSVLVASVLGEGTYADPGSIEFIKEEAIVLGEQIGLWVEYFFYIAPFVIHLAGHGDLLRPDHDQLSARVALVEMGTTRAL